jgi:hypothetical protein
MAWVPNGGLRDIALIAQEGKEALHHAEAGRDGPWRQRLVEGRLDPHVDINKGGLCQVLIQRGLPRCGQQDREASERTDGRFLHRGRLVAGTQVGEIVRH